MKKVMIIVIVGMMLFCCIFSVIYLFASNVVLEGMKRIVPSETEKIEEWQYGLETDDGKGHIVSVDVCQKSSCGSFRGASPWRGLIQGTNGDLTFTESSYIDYVFNYQPIENVHYYADWNVNCDIFNDLTKISSDYGPRGGGFHSGIDFGLYNGTEINSLTNGEVVYADFYGGWGYTVMVENNDYLVLYGHASEINVEVGDIVEAGDVLMLSGGATGNLEERTYKYTNNAGEEITETMMMYPYALNGNSTGGHLHLETRICDEDGCRTAIHPYQMLESINSSACTWYQDNISSNTEIFWDD